MLDGFFSSQLFKTLLITETMREPIVLIWSLEIALGATCLAIALLAYLSSQIQPCRNTLCGDYSSLSNEFHEQNSRLAMIAEKTSNAVIVTDKYRRISWVNEGFTRITGYQLNEIIGKNPGHFLQCEETCQATIKGMREAMDRLESYRCVLLNQGKDKKKYYLEINLHPTFSDSGEHTGFVAIESDVTEQKRIQTELEDTTRFLHGTLDSITANIAVLDENGTILFVNKYWKAFAVCNGMINNTFSVGSNYLTITKQSCDEDAIAVYQGILSVMNRETNFFQYEYQCDSPEEARWFTMTVSCFEGEGPQRIVVAHQNITDRKLAEIRLRSKEQKLRSIYDSSSDAIMLLTGNSIIECNAKAIHMFRLGNEDACRAIHPSELSPKTQPDGTSSFDKANRHIQTAFEKGEARFEWLHKRTDGVEFPAEVLLTSFEYKGQQVLQATVRDISERKLAQEQLQALNKQLTEDLQARIIAEERLKTTTGYLDVYRRIVDNHAIVAETDTTGKIISVNDAFCRISGYSREELIGENHRILNSGVHPQSMWVEMYKTVAKGGFWHGEICNRSKNGKLYWVDTTIAPLYDEQGKIRGYFAIRADITSLKEAQVQAESASKTKSEFLANMSHEIRTPMTAILGYADILAEAQFNGKESDASLECIDTIKRNGEHLLSIINDILDISKIEADKMTTETIRISPFHVVRDVIDLMKVKSQAKGLQLSSRVEGAIPETIQTDPTRLRQILVNLVGNAIKFTEVGSVTIAMRMDKGNANQICFDIIDTGIGLREEQVAKLFRSFEQVDTSMTRKFGGTGLGLRISKRLAEILGGDIDVTCRVGGGCTFTVRVNTGSVSDVAHICDPAEIPPDSYFDKKTDRLKNKPDTLEPIRPLMGVRVLLVEDGPDNQRLIAFHLRKAGATVHIIENGKLAVEFLSTDNSLEGDLNSPIKVDLVLMDMQMPIMDGYQATSILRMKGFTLPILALTAHAMDIDLMKCIDAGCNCRLTKPIDKKILIDTCVEWSAPSSPLPVLANSFGTE